LSTERRAETRQLQYRRSGEISVHTGWNSMQGRRTLEHKEPPPLSEGGGGPM